MNGHGYVVSPTPMKPPPLGPQDFNYRWPSHVAMSSEREAVMSAHLLEKNYNQPPPPRLEGKYTTVRNPPYDMRSRYDASSLMHEEQQRFHALYMEQFYRGTSNDMRTLQVSSDMRFPPVYDGGRQSTPKNKGSDETTQSHEMSKSLLEAHYSQDSKVGYNDGDGQRYFQNGYSTGNVSNGKLSHNESKRYASVNTEISDHHAKDGGGAMVHPSSLPTSHHVSQQKTNEEPLCGNVNMFSQNNLSSIKDIKEEEEKRSNVTDTTNGTEKEEQFEHALSVDISHSEKLHPPPVKEKENTAEECVKDELTENNVKSDKEEFCNSDKSPTEKFTGDEVTDNGLPSYTAMIAQAILKKSSKSTLSDIYEYMEKTFPSLEKRGTGWRNCVRHTLSLNDCFLKLHRPENGRSCNWTIHPSYYESFSRGDYRKKRALRKRARGLQWMDPINFNGYSLMREYDIHPDVSQQQHNLFHHPPPAGMWVPSPQNGYNCSFVQSSPDHLHHLPSHPSPSHTSSSSANLHPPSPYGGTTHLNHPGQFESTNCTNAECYCQYNRNNCSRVYSM